MSVWPRQFLITPRQFHSESSISIRTARRRDQRRGTVQDGETVHEVGQACFSATVAPLGMTGVRRIERTSCLCSVATLRPVSGGRAMHHR